MKLRSALRSAARATVAPGPRGPAARGAAAADDGLTRHIELDFPVRSVPRYPLGGVPHAGLHAILDRGREDYKRILEGFLEHRDCMLGIPMHAPADGGEPHWANGWMAALDVVALHGMLARTGPRRYLEVGSGISTRVARRTIREHGLRCEIVSIDPSPRAEVDALCDRVIRRPLEDVDLGVVDELEPGDMLYVDGSHRCFMNSDVTVLFLDVLPRLRPGVLVHIHDIFLPWDYPADWALRMYSEQYLLAAALLAGGTSYETVLPSLFCSYDHELGQVLSPLWHEPALSGCEPYGVSFWMRRA